MPTGTGEAALKNRRAYGAASIASEARQAPAPTAYNHFGFVVVCCERADLRPTPNGIMIFGEEEQRFEALPSPTVDDVAQNVGLPAQELTVTRQGFVQGFSGDTAPLVDAAMSGKVGQLIGPVVLSDGAVVLQIEEQKKVDAKEAQANRTAYAEMLRQQQARDLRTVLLNRLRKESAVEINPAVLRQGKQAQQAGL